MPITKNMTENILKIDIEQFFKNCYNGLAQLWEKCWKLPKWLEYEYIDITTVEVPSSMSNLPTDENITPTNNSHSLEQVQSTPSPFGGASFSKERTPPIAAQFTSKQSLEEIQNFCTADELWRRYLH